MERKTTFSEDRIFRYSLWREWSMPSGMPLTVPLQPASAFTLFIALNPSTADETQDDPTVRRCIGYSKAWGYSAYCMANIFAFRATDPRVMKAACDPIGPDNDAMLLDLALHAGVVVAAWGTHGTHLLRAIKVKRMLIENGVDLKCLKITNGGHPSHPLYLKADLKPIPFPLT